MFIRKLIFTINLKTQLKGWVGSTFKVSSVQNEFETWTLNFSKLETYFPYSLLWILGIPKLLRSIFNTIVYVQVVETPTPLYTDIWLNGTVWFDINKLPLWKHIKSEVIFCGINAWFTVIFLLQLWLYASSHGGS